MLFSTEKEKTAVRRVRFLNRLNYELTFAQRFDIINLWSLPSAIDGKRSKTVAAIPRVRSGGVCIASREIFLGEVIHITITLQDVFWIVSIAWMLYQAWDKFHNRKK